MFIGDVLINKIYLLAAYNKYPTNLIGAMSDTNDTVAFYGSTEPDTDHTFGDYYLRALPDFALYDLISSRQFIFNLFSFSMAPASDQSYSNGYDILELDQEKLGFTNGSLYQDYHYYQQTNDATYDITLRRLPGMGKPVFFIKILESTQEDPGRLQEYNFRSQPHPSYPDFIQNLTINGEEMI